MRTEYNFNSRHSLPELFRQAFGYVAPPFFWSLQNLIESKLFGKPSSEQDYEWDERPPRKEVSNLNVPFYANNSNGFEMFLPIWLITPTGERFLLQNTVATLSNKKTIVETPMVNRKGTVKEEIAVEDWQINIKGIIISNDGGYPEEEVAQLSYLYSLQSPLGVENARTALVMSGSNSPGQPSGDEKLVIKSLKLPEVKGFTNMQAFELECVSDIDFSLTIE